RIRPNVDLPEPLSPTTPRVSPALMSRSTSLNAGTIAVLTPINRATSAGRRTYVLLTPRTFMSGSAIARRNRGCARRRFDAQTSRDVARRDSNALDIGRPARTLHERAPLRKAA